MASLLRNSWHAFVVSLFASKFATTCLASPQCSSITLPVSINAQNLAIPATIDASTFQSFINAVVADEEDLITNTIDVNGTYTIAASYCEPEVVNASRSQTLQLLVHGITQTRNYWNSFATPGESFFPNNSWVEYASQQGFPTLVIDRLGSGNSSHPDGTLIVQLPAQVETIHSLVSLVRSGAVGSRNFTEIIYVGHSLGSELGNAHAANYPDDVDAYVLTGYTPFVNNALPSTGVLAQPISSAVELPEEFGDLPLDYLTPSDQNGTDHLFFYIPFINETLLELSWTTRGTVTIGELVSTLASPSTVAQYLGDVFVLTGDEDSIFCAEGIGGVETIITEVGNCDAGQVQAVQSEYPNARNYGFSIVANTGHGTILQESAPQQFETVFSWLTGIGY